MSVKPYKHPSVPGVTVIVNTIKHLPKCARCFKHLQEVDNDPVFAMTCIRCASVMHTLFYDVNFGHYDLIPHTLTRDVNEFIELYVRTELKHMSWHEINDKIKEQE